jgi:hypothetical protein
VRSACQLTQAHLGWLAGVRLGQSASQRTLEDYRGAVGVLMVRREQLEAEIARDRHAHRGRAVRHDEASWQPQLVPAQEPAVAAEVRDEPEVTPAAA